MATSDEGNLPSQLNTSSCGPGLEVPNKEKLVVKYTGRGVRIHDVGSIQANKPVPLNRRVYYFEVTVLETGDTGKVGVGFSDKNFNLSKQPGWDQNSFGYFGDDGKKLNNGLSQRFSERFGKGDVIGAGYHIKNQNIFFTKNNKYLGAAFHGVKGQLFPTISLQSKNDEVSINFGNDRDKPFVFDLEVMLAGEQEVEQNQIAKISVTTDVTHTLVRQYLLHYGYADTISAFDEVAGASSPDNSCSTSGSKDWLASSLSVRQSVRQLILAGDIEAARKLVMQHFPGLLEGAGAHSEVAFYMHCQHYIELIRQGKIEQAVTFAQQALSPMRLAHQPDRDTMLRDVVAVVAYQNPEASPLGHLLSTAQREVVADVVNAAIMSATAPEGHPGPPKSGVELLLQQLGAVHAALREGNGNQGEVFDLTAHLCKS